MAQYIDKDALVAEIKERIETYNKGYANGDDRRVEALEILLHDLNTLEVKEVDLEKEINHWQGFAAFPEGVNITPLPKAMDIVERTAKHFFELGLNTRQNISVDVTDIDKVMKENGVDPNSKEAKMFKESYYMALEKLKAQKGE